MVRERLLLRVYGDSLSMPRSEDGIPYYRTYAELLVERYQRLRPSLKIHLHQRFWPGATVDLLFKEYQRDSAYYGRESGDVLLIYCGICDCAPRPIPQVLKRCVARAPGWLQGRLIRFLHRHRAGMQGAGLVWQQTAPAVFGAYFRRWLDRVITEMPRAYVINIAPTTEAIEGHSPGLRKSIADFNEIMRQTVAGVGDERVRLIDLHQGVLCQTDGIESYVSARDGHHLTGRGHELLCRLICDDSHDDL